VQLRFDFEIKLSAPTAAARATMSAQLSSSDIENVQADKLKAVIDLGRALEQWRTKYGFCPLWRWFRSLSSACWRARLGAIDRLGPRALNTDLRL
jgi:hypothetical protein